MASFSGSHQDPLVPFTPSPLPGLHEHETAPFRFSITTRRGNLTHANSVFPKYVPLHVLQKMTNYFSKDRELGRGAYGSVYKGVHVNGETIAVKLLNSMTALDNEQFEEEFWNLTRVEHKNIVRLVGFCHETQRQCVPHKGKMVLADLTKMALCFEYMHNGSLDNYIFDEGTGHDWPTRYAIIKGICQGLKYLHDELKMYHLDLKPANILLDGKMLPKISDFGLSRLFGQEHTRMTESPIGTFGYLPPEYIENNIICDKFDIFSLGVIIIKIISGREGYTQRHSNNFIGLVHGKWKSRLQQTSLDKDASQTYSKQVMECIEMALSCVENDRQKRPSIGDIIDELNMMETIEDPRSSIAQVVSVDKCSTPAQGSLPPAAGNITLQETTTNTNGVSGLSKHLQYAMGDLVMGLVKSVVEGALKKADEAILPQSVQRDLVFIIDEFKMMQSFLNLAYEERVNNTAVRAWVRQMHELAYDLENWIEFVVHLNKTASFWFEFFPSCLAGESPLTLAVQEIKMLKARVKDLSVGNSRNRVIGDSDSKHVLAQQQPAPPSAAGDDMRIRHQILWDLTQLITKKDVADLQVISVWGEGGGIGTTSIVRKSYNDPEISNCFTCRAWVNLTHPFNPHEFVRTLMAHFYTNRCFEEQQGAIVGVDVLTSMDVSATHGDLLSEFGQLVRKNRYLVVLEDLSTMSEWDSIRTFLPDRKNGSWIIVSSQKYEIASLCVGDPFQVFDLKHFPAEQSIYAFLKKGFQDNRCKREASSDSTTTRCKEISTEYGLSHHLRNDYSSSHRIPNCKMKATMNWMQNPPLVGCHLQMNQLRHYAVQEQMNHSQVMSVWGIAGVGKSALVRNFYYDMILENKQFEKYSWVGLSPSQSFDLRDFSRCLLMDFQSEFLQAKETSSPEIVQAKETSSPDFPEAKETSSLEILQAKETSSSCSNVEITDVVQKCSELLSTRRCLVVIDGLRSIHEWDLIQSSLVSRHSESKTVIIVITTEASIAKYCADKEELVVNVKTLEADAAFNLFENEVSKKTPLPSPLSSRGKEVLGELISKCGGLPLIIVAMAGILATKGVSLMDTASSINLRFMHELEMNPEFDSLCDLFSWMHSCFRDCPDSIKACIFYLSVFPRDHNIRRRRLVRRWIAEGYFRDSNIESAEENGEELLCKLLNLNIVQQPPGSATTEFSDARMVLCQVNGFFRECILSWGMEENFVIELTDICSQTAQRSGHHLVISEGWDRDRIVFQSIDFSRIRSMTVFGKWESFFISTSMRLLWVLDLENASGVTDKDVEKMVMLLPRLKFLSLRGCRGIFHLPSSFGGLRLLETLDVVNTSIVTLPETITKLQNLQYIRGGATTITAEDPSVPVPHTPTSCLSMLGRRRRLVGVKVPRGVRNLTALHTLGVVNIGGSAGKAILEELENLTQLRKLEVFGTGSRYHISKLPQNLQSLKLYGLMYRLPDLQDNQLRQLAKLDLEMAALMEEGIRFIGRLPNLCILRLRVNQQEYLKFVVLANGVEERSYHKVKVLDIACTSKNLRVTFGSETMKNLYILKVDCRNGSSLYELSGLCHLPQLKEVCLKGFYQEALKQEVQEQLSDHPNKPALKVEGEIPRSST